MVTSDDILVVETGARAVVGQWAAGIWRSGKQRLGTRSPRHIAPRRCPRAVVDVGEYYNYPNLTADLVGFGFLPPQATSNLPGGAVTTITAATPLPALVG